MLDVAAELGTRLMIRGRDFDGVLRADGTWDYRDSAGRLDALPPPALTGEIQVANAATAIAALRCLAARLPLSRTAVEDGLRRTRLPGRFQRLHDPRGFEWVLDVAHNPDSSRVLAGNLARLPVPGRTLAVCGMLADKDVPGVLDPLRDRIERWFAATTEGSRGLDASELARRGRAAGVEMVTGGSVVETLQLAAGEARAGDRVVVFGSFHTVGPALGHLRGGT
jgi:dihydrofolate synthase/folylpolyglutamate synthase